MAVKKVVKEKGNPFLQDLYISQTIKFETGGDKTGAYHDDPKDMGRETKWGISAAAHPGLKIKALTYKQATEIYKTEYWQECYNLLINYPDFSPIMFKLFDMGVLMGVDTSVKRLQKAINALGATLKVDGELGTKTLEAARISAPNALYDALITQYKKYVWYLTVKRPTNLRFIKGWLNRINFKFGA